jgi:hypothetical protein
MVTQFGYPGEKRGASSTNASSGLEALTGSNYRGTARLLGGSTGARRRLRVRGGATSVWHDISVQRPGYRLLTRRTARKRTATGSADPDLPPS